MKKVLKFLSDYKKEVVLAPAFKMLEASFELFVPLVMAAIINEGIEHSNISYVAKMGIVLVALALVGLACSVTAQYFAAKAATGFSTRLRQALFAQIEKLSFKDMDQVGTSTLITRMTSDVNQLQSGVNMVLRLFLRSPFVVLGAMIMAFTVDVKGALVFVVTIPLLSIVVFGIMLITMPMYKKVQKALDQILGRTRENLAGARVIRAFNKEADEVEAFQKENELLTNFQLVVGRISALMNPVTLIIVNIATLLVIWFGGLQVFDGQLRNGDVVALVNYMSQILVELVKLANLIILITKAVACGNRVQEVLELTPSLKDEGTLQAGDSNAEYEVEFDHVSMGYNEGAEMALSDICLKVKKGQTIGIIGGTGSGKTTLVHLIPRFYEVTSGSVKVKGKDVREYTQETIRDMVGIVMQKAVLFKGTIAENLRWGKADATEEEMWKAVDIAQAMDFVEEKSLDHMVEAGGKNLSGGQRQRLTIARAVVKDADILILDDSASALDYATDARLRKALKEKLTGKTVFIVSQRTSSIQHADQILVLDDGKAVGIGTHEQLLENCEVYKEIYDSQFKKSSDVKKEVQ